MCEDPAVLGAPFFVMERRRGFVLREEIPPEIAAVARIRADQRSVPGCAGEAARHRRLAPRLRATWASPRAMSSARCAAGRTDGSAPKRKTFARWMAWSAGWPRGMPPPLAPSLIHNDYKLDNVMLAAGSPDRVEAVLDWEMATLGDPLSDLGLTLCYWVWATAPEVRAAGIPALTVAARLAHARSNWWSAMPQRTGRDVTHIGYYEVLGVFKLAVIIQQIYCRFHRGQTHDERFRNFGERGQCAGAGWRPGSPSDTVSEPMQFRILRESQRPPEAPDRLHG